MADLRKAFGTKYGLSSILAADYNYLKNMDPQALSAHVDWFNFMSYDLHGTWDAQIEVSLSIVPH